MAPFGLSPVINLLATLLTYNLQVHFWIWQSLVSMSPSLCGTHLGVTFAIPPTAPVCYTMMDHLELTIDHPVKPSVSRLLLTQLVRGDKAHYCHCQVLALTVWCLMGNGFSVVAAECISCLTSTLSLPSTMSTG